MFICLLTGEDASTTLGISNAAFRIDAVLGCRQGVITNAILSIAQLSKLAGGTTGRGEVEAATVTAANKCVGTSSEGCKGNKILHHSCGLITRGDQ